MNSAQLASQNLNVVRAVSFAYVSEANWDEVAPIKAEKGEEPAPAYSEELSSFYPEPPDVYTVPPEKVEASDEHWTAAILEGGKVLVVRTPGASNANSLTAQISVDLANAGPMVWLVDDGNVYRSTGTIPLQRTLASTGQATLSLAATQLELCNINVDKEAQTFTLPVGVAQEITVSFDLETEAETVTFSPEVMNVFSINMLEGDQETEGEVGAELATLWQCWNWACNIWDWTIRLLHLAADLSALMPYALIPIIWAAIAACLVAIAFATVQLQRNLHWFIEGDCRVYLGG